MTKCCAGELLRVRPSVDQLGCVQLYFLICGIWDAWRLGNKRMIYSIEYWDVISYRNSKFSYLAKHLSAPLSDVLVNPWLNKSKRVFSSGGARTHTTREMKNSSLMLYQLSYQGLMLVEAIVLIYILIPKFLIIFHHYLIFLETRPSWKGQ